MKRTLIAMSALSALSAASSMTFAAETGDGSGAAPATEAAPAAAPVERQKQNGFTRPIAGTKTGLVWDIADEISSKKAAPALRDEVMTEYKNRVPDASDGTISTQYSRWCGFHGVQDVLRKMRAEEKAKETAEKEAEKAKKAAEKAAEKEAKEKAAAEKKAAADAKKKAAADKKAAAAAAAAKDTGSSEE